jgi:hypothetical protein
VTRHSSQIDTMIRNASKAIVTIIKGANWVPPRQVCPDKADLHPKAHRRLQAADGQVRGKREPR